MMRKKPSSRYEDCQEVFEVLSRWLASQGETVTGSMYATIAVRGSSAETDPGVTPSEQEAGSHVLGDEAKALARSLDEAQEPLDAEPGEDRAEDQDLVFLPTVDVGDAPPTPEAVDLIDVNLPEDDSSSLSQRITHRRPSKKLGMGFWLGIFALFCLVLGFLIALVSLAT